jgi:hypothetical protein
MNSRKQEKNMDHETSTFLRDWMDSRRRRVPSGSPVPSSSEASATQVKKCCGGKHSDHFDHSKQHSKHSKHSKHSDHSKHSKHSGKDAQVVSKPVTVPIHQNAENTGNAGNAGNTKPTWPYLIIFGAVAGCGWKAYTYYYTIFPTEKAKHDARTELIWLTVAAVVVSLYVYRNFLSK